MATASTTSTTKRTAAKKATTTRPAAKKTVTKRTSAASSKTATTRKRPSAKKATSTRRAAAPKRTPLLERDPQTIAQDASYAAAGLAVGSVTLGKAAVAKIAELRSAVADAAADPRATLRSVADDAPTAARTAVDGVRHKLVVELESAIAAFERTFDARATEGRKLLTSLERDQRISKLVEQGKNTRSQLKGALTSVTRTADVATEAARKQAETATSQVKAAVTSVRKTADAVPGAAEAAADRVDSAS